MTFLLLVWTIVGCTLPNIWLAFTERMTFIQSLTGIILPLGIYMLLMSVTPKVGKATLWMVILFFFAAFQAVLLYMYGRSVIAVDMFLNVVTTNPGEVGELLGNMMFIIIAVVVVYVPPIILAVTAQIRHWLLPMQVLKTTRRVSLIIIAAGLVCFTAAFFSPSRKYRPHCDLYPVNVLYNLYLACDRTVKVADYDNTSRSFSFNAEPTHPDSVPEVYIVVVGETSRADNWQINGYNRPTTPRLTDVRGLYSFPRAISQSNTTHKSVPMLLSHLDASNFGDSIYYVKSLVTAFKEAGFHTAYFSAHSRNHSFIDFFADEADETIFIKEQGNNRKHYYDTDLLPFLDRKLAEGHKKLLVVLHAYGSHFNYIDRYPDDRAVFTPDRPARATHHYRDKQINAYDNTIRFTSDFLADIISRLQESGLRSAMIYTSDHGEDIFDDDRRLFLHASPIPSYWQIHVPFIVWLSDSYSSAYPAKAKALGDNTSRYVASSRVFFHSILDMAGIATPRLSPSFSVLDSGYTPGSAIYLNDHNEQVPLMQCGILEQDIENLARLGIR